ncbi:TetR/AcrR family transcriptional regulator [Brevibacterium casei]|jgi:AcrR family transcriptional regulator|uniref:TetR family transcriptional regulator n=1 Tax=Brevibacterium casei TaxID=33889 RepID=A0A7T3ZYG9_9MICO|nr:TetR family transcriptional regulator C-terminal domain-containing protein [Brevibacterium casei]QQB13993.1 TetR family transcriptional regulator [Brevibacterium casei]
MGRKRAEVRREEILAATIDEIEATGLRALRVADVARRLDLSASLVIYHFATKEALVTEAFAFAGENDLDRARAIVAADRPAQEILDDLLAWYLPSGSTRSWTIWMDAWSAALFDEEIRRTLARLDRAWQTVFAEVVRAGAAAGEFTVAPGDIAEAVTKILAHLDGLSVRLMTSETDSRALMLDWVRDFADSALGRARPRS